MTARILVVDDIAANRRLLEAKLLADYYEVLTSSSGEEALEAAFTQLPDIVLLDVMMPGMDGYEVCRRLKAAHATRHIPVVMVTALTDSAERVRGLEAGADDFLSKPVDDATLAGRVRALLRIKQVQDAWRLRAETARELGLPPPPEIPDSAAGARAVICSDSAAEASAMARMLEPEGIEVSTAANAEEAWAALVTSPPDLALLSLPADDGAEALRLASRLRAHSATRDTPLLLLADPMHKPLVLRGFDIGVNDHVLRPVDPHELRARARNQIRRKRMQDRLRTEVDRSLELAVTDALTGLRNRRYIQRHLETMLATTAAAVLLLDIDRFKLINDTHGHGAGDEVLREVARRLVVELRAADVVARWGGEEFLALVAGAPASHLLLMAERLRQALEETPVRTTHASIPVTVSIGVAAAEAGASAEALIEAADTALYQAKGLGRNRTVLAHGLA